MAKAKITKKSVDALTKGETLFDTELRGFMVRARGSSKSFAVKYSVAGRQRIFTLGRYGDLTADQARTAAQDALNRANKARHHQEARDPQAQRELERTAPKNLVADVCTEFVNRHAKKNRSWNETERILNRHIIPAWGRRPIEGIKRSEVVALLDGIEDESGAPMATAVLAQVRKMFNWQATRDDNFNTPIVKGMARTSPNKMKRNRVLNDDEIRVMWQALDACAPPYRQLVRFLLLTAQRRDEASRSSEDELGAEHSGANTFDLWSIPAERYKTGVPNLVPLSAGALAQIEDLPKLKPKAGANRVHERAFLFTTTGDRPFSGFSKAKKRLDAEMERILRDRAVASAKKNEVLLKPWRLHDLRRTAKTLMQRVGVRPDISERVLGHVIAGVEGTYDRYAYLPEKRHALEALEAEIERITVGIETNVFQMRATARPGRNEARVSSANRRI
jgi:hypothetical protein